MSYSYSYFYKDYLPFEDYNKSYDSHLFLDNYDSFQPQDSLLSDHRRTQLAEDAIQVKKELQLLDKNFHSHKEFYVVSTKWFNLWKKAMCFDQIQEASPIPAGLGRIELPKINGDIVANRTPFLVYSGKQQYLNVFLKKGLTLEKDYILVNENIWNILKKHKGNEIKRYMRDLPDGRMVDVSLAQFEILYFFNSSLKRIQKGQTKLLRTWVQTDKTTLLKEFNSFLESKIKDQFKSPSCKQYLAKDKFFKLWKLDEQVTLGRWVDQMEKLCRMHKGWTYRIQIEGPLLKDQNKKMYELDISPQTKVVVEILCQKQNWIFYNKTTPIYSKCDNCDELNELTFKCSCKVAYYCSSKCKKANKEKHRYRCETDTISEEQVTELKKTAKSRMGMVGLRNLGNTCYMNSGLQCISHVKPLVEYILSNDYQLHLNSNNPLGSVNAELAKAYCDLVKAMWYGEQDCIAPVRFKKAIGAFQPMFSGYGQQDSGQFVNYLLDGLHQDLNKIKKKEYIEMNQNYDRPDEEMALEAWNTFRKRNNSVIVDLMYGQYKSRVECDKCPNFSITFDPFLVLQLPIPLRKKKTFQFYLADEEYNLFASKVTYQDKQVISLKKAYELACAQNSLMVKEDIYCFAASTFFCEYVQAQEKNVEPIRKNFKDRKSIVIRGCRPWQLQAKQSPYNLIISNYHKHQSEYYSKKSLCFVRMARISTKWTLAEVLTNILSDYLKFLPKYDKSLSVQANFKPYIESNQFRIIYSRMYRSQCNVCSSQMCDGCNLPFSQQVFADVFKGDKIQFQLIWNKRAFQKIDKQIEVKNKQISSGYSYTSYRSYDVEHSEPCKIQDCFYLFQQTEVLDEDNKWYCNKCKEFVCARKTMQIYKLPETLIICLKRFKSQNKLYMKKINAIVNYPITDFHLGKFSIDPEQKNSLYELTAVSNHMGSMGGGHYTAYCLDDGSGQWCQFDDSHVRKMQKPPTPQTESYLLFYRLKK